VVYKHYVVHPDTVTAAHMGACAAGRQGKFMEFKELFWTRGFGGYKAGDKSALGRETIDKIAADIGLDIDRFNSDIEGGDCAGRIKADMQTLSNFGVNATPSFFINGRFSMFSNPNAFRKLIDEELARVGQSGVAPAEFYESEVMGKGLKQFRSKADATKGAAAEGG
jgi:protein-disulfide isomerase